MTDLQTQFEKLSLHEPMEPIQRLLDWSKYFKDDEYNFCVELCTNDLTIYFDATNKKQNKTNVLQFLNIFNGDLQKAAISFENELWGESYTQIIKKNQIVHMSNYRYEESSYSGMIREKLLEILNKNDFDNFTFFLEYDRSELENLERTLRINGFYC